MGKKAPSFKEFTSRRQYGYWNDFINSLSLNKPIEFPVDGGDKKSLQASAYNAAQRNGVTVSFVTDEDETVWICRTR